MDQVIDTKLLCQRKKVGEILLRVDIVQTEVVVVNEVNEQAGGADSDTRKIDDDIFNGLGKHSDCLVWKLSFNYCTYFCCGSIKLLTENVANAGQEWFVGGENPDVTVSVDNSELDVQWEPREVERERSPCEGRRQAHFEVYN